MSDAQTQHVYQALQAGDPVEITHDVKVGFRHWRTTGPEPWSAKHASDTACITDGTPMITSTAIRSCCAETTGN